MDVKPITSKHKPSEQQVQVLRIIQHLDWLDTRTITDWMYPDNFNSGGRQSSILQSLKGLLRRKMVETRIVPMTRKYFRHHQANNHKAWKTTKTFNRKIREWKITTKGKQYLRRIKNG